MKKHLLIATVLTSASLSMFSCGSSDSPKEMTKQEKEKVLMENGQKYVDQLVLRMDKKERDELLSIEFTRIDSMVDLNEQFVYRLECKEKYQEYERENEFCNQLIDLDKSFGLPASEQTIHQLEKTKALGDEVEKMLDLQKKKSKKKIGDVVYFLAKMTNVDGSTQKTPFFVAFNDDLTVSADVMGKVFD